MKEFKNTRNPILPLEFHIPDSEGHMMPDVIRQAGIITVLLNV